MAQRLLLLAYGVAAIFSEAACSANSFSTVPTTSHAARPALAPVEHASASLVYVSDAKKNRIAVFDRNGTKAGTITRALNYPSGLFVDGSHNLWVANQGRSNVLEFARGGSAPILTLSDGKNVTEDVTICPDGDVYVATLLDGITRYAGAHHRKSGALRYYGAPFQFVTCDAAGNVFATGVAGTFGTVIAFPNGKESGAHMLPITTNGNLGGIKAEPNGDILVDNPGTVTEYTEDGTPTGRQLTTKNGWLDIALNQSAGVVFGADQTAEDGVSATFPGGKPRAIYRDSFSYVWGIAFDPGSSGIQGCCTAGNPKVVRRTRREEILQNLPVT